MIEVKVKLKTNAIFDPLFENQDRYLVLYGGTNAGKSVFAAQKIIRRCLEEEGHRFLLIRRYYKTIRESQYMELMNQVNNMGLNDYFDFKRGDPLKITALNNNEILTVGLDDPQKLRSLQGITSIWIEEPSQIEDEFHFDQVDITLRGDTKYYQQIMMTFNPMNPSNWTNTRFFRHITTHKGRGYVPKEQCPPDTSILNVTYLDNAFTKPDIEEQYSRYTGEFYRVYVLGEWGALTKENQVIPTEWIKMAMERWRIMKDRHGEDYIPDWAEDDEKKRRHPMTTAGVDPARGGADQTIIVPRYGSFIDSLIVFPGAATPDGQTVAGQVMSVIDKDTLVNIDAIGIGASPFDYLSDIHGNVNGLISSERSDAYDKTGRMRFKNLRTEMVWKAREALDPEDGADILLPDDIELLQDLTSYTWRLKAGGIIEVDSKDDIKKEIGRSPDKGDAVIYTLYDTVRVGVI